MRKKFIMKAAAYTILEVAILTALVFISWGFSRNTQEIMAGTFVFAGIYLLVGSLIISAVSCGISSRPSINIYRVQNPYLVSKAYAREGSLAYERPVERHEEPKLAFYGYFIGLCLFFLGLLILSL